MSDTDFGKAITQAARAVARIELKRRKFRKHLAELDAEYSEAQRALRLLVASVEPYTPPTSEETREAQQRAQEHE
jgi:hypothetical protein